MKKLKYLIQYGLKKRLFTKAFYISTAVIGVLLIGITLLPTIILNFTDPNQGELLEDEVLIVNTTTYDVGNADFTNYIITGTNAVINHLGYDNQVNFLRSEDPLDVPSDNYYNEAHSEQALIYIYRVQVRPGDPVNDDLFEVRVKVYNRGINSGLLEVIQMHLSELQRLKYKIDHPQLEPTLIQDLQPEFVVNPNIGDGVDQEILAALSPMLIIPIFILITIGLQFVGTEIMEEKSTKAIEIIIASVPPRTHFFAKVLSVMIFLVIQLFIYVLFGMIGYGLNEIIAGGQVSSGGSWNMILGVIAPIVLPTLILTLICSILGALIYCIIGAFVASLAVNQEDYQSIQTPVMMILLFSYMGGIIAGASQFKELLLVFAYVPFSAPLVIPVAFMSGYFGLVEASIGLVILLISTVLLMMVFTPLYRASILSYDQSSLIKRIQNTYKTAKVLKQNQKMHEENHID